MHKKGLKETFFIILLLIFILILYLVLGYDMNIFDDTTYKFVSRFINDSNTNLFKLFTFLGSTIAITFLCIIALVSKKYRYPIILNTIITVLISQALKFVIQRARPLGISLIEETGYSFPSGHSMVSAAFYGFICYLIYRANIKKTTKIILITTLTSLTVLIGVSRIYLGVHYSTDVFGGFVLALIHLIIFIELIYKKYFLKEK